MKKIKILLLIIICIFAFFMLCAVTEGIVRGFTEPKNKSTKVDKKISVKEKKDLNKSKETSKSGESKVSESKVTKKPEKTKSPKIKTENVIDKNTALEIMRKNYKGIATISFNRKSNAIEICPIDDSFMYAIYNAKQGNIQAREHWDKIVSDLKNTTKLLEDNTLMINILNNLNKENIVLSCVDGQVIYNVLN